MVMYFSLCLLELHDPGTLLLSKIPASCNGGQKNDELRFIHPALAKIGTCRKNTQYWPRKDHPAWQTEEAPCIAYWRRWAPPYLLNKHPALRTKEAPFIASMAIRRSTLHCLLKKHPALPTKEAPCIAYWRCTLPCLQEKHPALFTEEAPWIVYWINTLRCLQKKHWRSAPWTVQGRIILHGQQK